MRLHNNFAIVTISAGLFIHTSASVGLLLTVGVVDAGVGMRVWVQAKVWVQVCVQGRAALHACMDVH